MQLLVLMVTDWLFVFCIVLICDYYLILDRRDNKYKYLLSTLLVAVCSVCTYVEKNIFFDGAVILITIVGVIALCFKEKIINAIFISVWLFIIVSLISLIVEVVINIVCTLLNYKEGMLTNILEVSIVLLFIYVVSVLLRQKSIHGIKKIHMGYLLLYTILTVIDSFALIIMATVTLDKMAYKNKVLYGVTFTLVALGILIQLGAVILLMVSRDIYRQKEEIVHKYLNEQNAHYEYLEKREEKTKKFRHDLKNHICVLERLSETDSQKYKEYCDAILSKVDELRSNVSVNNSIVDAVLNRFYSDAVELNINFNISGHMPNNCNIDAYDLCTVFSNLLSNAFDAAKKESKKQVDIEISYDKEDIIVKVSNCFSGKVEIKNGQISTSKADKDLHGWGLQNVRDSVDKYDGIMDIDAKGNIFSATILLKNISEEIDL